MIKITDAEYEVMKAVWELGGVATSRELLTRFEKKRPGARRQSKP